MEKRFLDLILESGEVSEQKLNVANKEQKRTKELLLEVIIRLGLLTREQITRIWAQATGNPYIDLAVEKIDEEAIKLVPKNLAEKFKLLPFAMHGDAIKVGMFNPGDIIGIDALRRATRRDIEIYVANLEDINESIGLYFGEGILFDEEIDKNIASAMTGAYIEGETDPPVVRLIDLFIKKAIVERATDIHVSPDEKATRISFRIDGIMRPQFVLPKQLQNQIITRIKVMSKLNIAEQRVPQDGNISFEYSGRYIDIRTSTSPTDNGENVVLRLLDKVNIVMGMLSLGLSITDNEAVNLLSLKPHGIVLSAGPTGSGKTTTLYSILQEIDALERNILTIEDPIEYRLPYIKQTQVNEKAGLTFAKAIRHFLRQDPDVILVGEIRDLETSKIAFQAAMTGHLVLSTIHTNDAASSIARLMDLGIEAYLIPSCLRAVMAQRLVRKVCPHCSYEHTFTEDEINRYEITGNSLKSQKQGKGCIHCEDTGFRGRTGIFEILDITPSISELILQKVSSDQILLRAREEGMRTMREDGIDKIRMGTTTMAEVYRVTG